MAGKDDLANEHRHVLTVGYLREFIRDLDSNVEFDFGSTLVGVPLDYYRLKWRGEKFLQIEINEWEFGEG